MWDNANRGNVPYLLYEPDHTAPGARPERQPPVQVNAAFLQEAQIAADDMKATTGIYDASLGARSNETAGIAIRARQMEGDVANYHFIDNVKRSLEHAGRILLDLIPKVYDNQRVVRIQGASDEEQFVKINHEITGDYGERVILNDLSAGRFDIRVTIGPNYATKRFEAAANMLDLLKAFPQAAPLISDLIVKNMDWPGADEIAKRLKATVPPNILHDPEDPKSPPPPDPTQDPQFRSRPRRSSPRSRTSRRRQAIKTTMEGADLEARAGADAAAHRAAVDRPTQIAESVTPQTPAAEASMGRARRWPKSAPRPRPPISMRETCRHQCRATVRSIRRPCLRTQSERSPARNGRKSVPTGIVSIPEETMADASPSRQRSSNRRRKFPNSGHADPRRRRRRPMRLSPADASATSEQPKAPGEPEAPQKPEKPKADDKPKSRVQPGADRPAKKHSGARAEVPRTVCRASPRGAACSPSTRPDPQATSTRRMRLRSSHAIRQERPRTCTRTSAAPAARGSRTRVSDVRDAKLDDAAERIPDIASIRETFYRSVAISEPAADVLASSDKAAEITAFLVRNPAEAQRISSLHPQWQAVEIARLEARVAQAPQVRRVSQAPAPPPTIGGGSPSSAKSPADMSVAEIQALLYGKQTQLRL